MRKDMQNLLVDAGSRGKGTYPRGNRKYLQRTPVDELPSKEGIRAIWHRAQSEADLADYTNPLYRFLLAQAGRPWNDIWSEICEHNCLSHTMQRHVRTHVWDVVEKDIFLLDGVPYYRSTWGGSFLPLFARWYGCALYICPETGILKKWFEPTPKRPDEIPVAILWADKGTLHQHHLIKEIWYLVLMRPIDPRELKFENPLTGAYYTQYGLARVFGRDKKTGQPLIPVRKVKQLNSKEIKRAKLRE